MLRRRLMLRFMIIISGSQILTFILNYWMSIVKRDSSATTQNAKSSSSTKISQVHFHSMRLRLLVLEIKNKLILSLPVKTAVTAKYNAQYKLKFSCLVILRVIWMLLKASTTKVMIKLLNLSMVKCRRLCLLCWMSNNKKSKNKKKMMKVKKWARNLRLLFLIRVRGWRFRRRIAVSSK